MAAAPSGRAGGQQVGQIEFDRDIRPLLSDNCFQCHGPDEAERAAGLALHLHESAVGDLGGGYQAIVPGKPSESEVFLRVTEQDESLRMPPVETGRQLSDEQIELLRQWIEQGATWQNHWAFEPVQRPELPPVQNAAWPRNSIDHFILAELERRQLEPSPEAHRYTLIRRLYLDLLGLPPQPEQVDAFLADTRPGAYARVVDRVLASPHYGERWGRHWLDQARYADSNGYSIDSPRSIWPYRDWVIQALNDDLPFDQFTIEQLAGDLLPDPTEQQLVATGFHRNTLVNQEGGTDAEQFRVEAVVDRTNTTGTVWLGLTIGCAQCHTHKYDPVSQHEYFSLYSFFNSTEDRNSVGPTIRLPTSEQTRELNQLEDRIARKRDRLKEVDRLAAERRAEWEAGYAQPTAWSQLEPGDAQSQAGASFEPLEDGSLLVRGTTGESDRYTIRAASPLAEVTAVRLEALTDPSLPRGGPGRASNGNFVLNDLRLATADGLAATWSGAVADHSQKDYPVSAAIDGDLQTGWAINVSGGTLNVDRTAVFLLDEPLALAGQAESGQAEFELTLQFGAQPPKYNLGRFRLSVTDAPYPNLGESDPVVQLVSIPAAERTKEQQKQLDSAFEQSDAQRAAAAAELAQLEDQKRSLEQSIASTMVMRELDKTRPNHLHVRGDFLRKGDEVQPGVPAVLPGLPETTGHRTRHDLAHWLVGPDNPLTPRVTVNRIWMRYFGQGLVETENDFGMQGTLPTHPELLDWLASELISREWSLKALHRLIVTSATYRQASHLRPELQTVDPLNKLLARQSRFRVEAEVVRDIALRTSGLLTATIGGPSVYPPQPDGVYAFTQNRHRWNTSGGADRYRRGIYTFIYRSAPHPMLTTFDMPRLDSTCTSRIRSNTPLQSLTLANDEAMFEMAQAFAIRVLADQPDRTDAQRLVRAFRLSLGRHPTQREQQRLMEYLEQQREQLAGDPAATNQLAQQERPEQIDALQAAVWTMVGRVLMNLDEFVTRE